MSAVKISVKALIVQSNQVLCIKTNHHNQIVYSLPGGKQKPSETLAESLSRECLEEIGTPICVEDVFMMYDFMKTKKHSKKNSKHMLEVIFKCKISPNYTVRNGFLPDKNQLGVEWLNLNELHKYRFNPKRHGQMLQHDLEQNHLYCCLSTLPK